jgi:acid stress-induced BolA-like protein IbaG/YrbA
MIVLAAIRDYFYKASDSRADDIERPYLINRDFKTGNPTPKLIMNDIDRDYFTSRILLRPGTVERLEAEGRSLTKQSHKLINDAALKIGTKIDDLVNKHTTPDAKADALGTWFEFIKGGTRVIWLSVEDEAKAYVMFETLNDRGLELSKADLLKNFLLSRSGPRVNEVLNRWASMQAAIETSGSDEENLLVTFIRNFWSANYRLTRERELYASIKDEIRGSETKAVKLADSLSISATTYAAILNSSSAYWNDFGDSVHAIRTLNHFKLKQIRPLVLAIASKMQKKNIEKALKLLVRCSVRFLIVGGLGGGRLEEKYTEAANKITSGEIKTAAKLLEFLKPAVPNNTEFSSSFAFARVSSSPLAKYYLRSLEMTKKGDPNAEWQPTEEKGVNLEHILPQNPSAEWTLSPDVVESYYERLGNLALLSKRVNKSVQNRYITTKAPHYDSSYSFTKELKTATTWGPSEIDERQKRMAQLAVKTWPLSIS